METAIYITISLVLIYSILFFIFFLHLKQNPKNYFLEKYPEISVIIPFRNEEKNLENLFNSILQINYPSSGYEIIFVNDESQDASVSLVNEFAVGKKNIRLIHSCGGKKQALLNGVTESQFELIACTDADSVLSKDWLMSTAFLFENPKIQLVLGTVVFREENSLFKKIMELEFSGLMASTAGSALSNLAIMANGASIFFRKELYVGFSPNLVQSRYKSGDDTFLLSATIAAHGYKSIAYNLHPSGIVITSSPNNFSEFFQQRLRWASKSHVYGNLIISSIALLVLLSNFGLLALLFIVIAGEPLPLKILSLLGILLKLATDYMLVNRFRTIIKAKTKPLLFLVSWIFIPIYYFIVILLLPFIKVKWKGRGI